jgi:4-hydroxy-4-methyl-2-oxoglutarate aldolase
MATVALTPVPIDVTHLASRFLALTDLSSTVSDALDELGIGGVVAGTRLAPLLEDSRVCGPAVTMRSVADPHPAQAVDDRAIYAAGPAGGVIVIDLSGAEGAAGLGGIGATIAARAGLAGVVVDGPVRDAASLRELGLPVWSRGRTPVSRRGRASTVEQGGVVSLSGVPVHAGDLVLGDSTGVCVVPAGRAAEVLDRCEAIEAAEAALLERLASERHGSRRG